MTSIDIDEVIFNLKATITSSKGGVLLKSIESDYHNINGTCIPYRELGYSSLKKFIQSFKVFRIDESRNDPIVNVVSDVKTQHLQEMIKKQKTTKKSKYKKKPKVIHKKFTSDYSANAKQPYKRKVVSNIHNYTSAVSSTNTLDSKWLKNYELPTYKSKVTTVSSKNNHTSAVLSKSKLDSKWLKNDELCTYESGEIPVSKIINQTSAVSSKKTFDSKLPKNEEKRKPILLKKITKLCGQSAQDRLQKYVKKDISQMEIKDYSNNSLFPKNFNYLCQKTSELTNTYDKVNDTNIMNSPIELSTNQPEPLNTEINQLQIPSKCKMTVTVTAIYSLLDIWVCLDEIEKNESFCKMQKELKIYMDSNNLSPIKQDPIIGHFYALYHQLMWHRISIECIDFDGSIICFLIDTGKSMHANKNQIYPLASNFFNIPGQAINILLNKFKIFNDFPLIKDILIETLIDQKFLLIPHTIITSPPSVTLYEVESMMNVNDELLHTFFEKVTSKFSYTIEYKFTEAKVLSILDGYLYLQPNKDLIKSLENLLLTDLFSTGFLKNNRDIDYRNVYLTTYKQNIKGRVKVLYFIDDSWVKIFFIDYGVYRNVELQELININKIDNLVAKIPPQAVKTILHMFPPQCMTNKTIDEFFNILGNNYYVSVMGLNDSDNDIPCVQLWTGAFPDTCINMVLYSRLEKIKKNCEESNT